MTTVHIIGNQPSPTIRVPYNGSATHYRNEWRDLQIEGNQVKLPNGRQVTVIPGKPIACILMRRMILENGQMGECINQDPHIIYQSHDVPYWPSIPVGLLTKEEWKANRENFFKRPPNIAAADFPLENRRVDLVERCATIYSKLRGYIRIPQNDEERKLEEDIEKYNKDERAFLDKQTKDAQRKETLQYLKQKILSLSKTTAILLTIATIISRLLLAKTEK